MEYEEKPPIGIVPERIWKQKRAEELTKAISRYVSERHYGNSEHTIIAWCHELEGLVRDLANKYPAADNNKLPN